MLLLHGSLWPQVAEAAAANEALIKQKMATPSEVAQRPFTHAIHATCALLCLLAAGAWVPLFLANCCAAFWLWLSAAVHAALPAEGWLRGA